MRKSRQQKAKLRTCASCEWIHEGFEGCPKCGFGTYGARWVYGDAAYRHKHTQAPWKKKKLDSFEATLNREIEEAKTKPPVFEYNRIPEE